MERNKVIEILKEQGYPTFILDKTADKIEKMSPSLNKAFVDWVEQGIEPTFSIHGYSYSFLIEKFNMNPIGAFICLDWIIREPEEAIEKLNCGIM